MTPASRICHVGLLEGKSWGPLWFLPLCAKRGGLCLLYAAGVRRFLMRLAVQSLNLQLLLDLLYFNLSLTRHRLTLWPLRGQYKTLFKFYLNKL
jgi:hypothetical protein